MKKKIGLVSSVLVILAGLLVGCDLFNSGSDPIPQPTPVTVSGVIAEANLVPAESTQLSFSIPGKVAVVLVEEGDQVSEGQVIARLDQKSTTSLEAQILTAELAVLEAQQVLDDIIENAELVHFQAQVDLVRAQQNLWEVEQIRDAVDTDAYREDLDDARIEMIEAKENLDDAVAVLADYQDLDVDHPTRKAREEDVEDAQAAYDEARWVFEDLQYRYDLAESQLGATQEAVADSQRRVDATADGPDSDDLALAQANLAQAEGQHRAALYALGDVELTAPFGGRVVRVDLIEGAMTSPELPAIVLMDDSHWYLETSDLTEIEVVKIEVGEEVAVTFDALPGRKFTGEVESISNYFLDRYGDITYVVRIRLLQKDEQLRWGMTAEVQFTD
jgi:multidrug resistance efflux pump